MALFMAVLLISPALNAFSLPISCATNSMLPALDCHTKILYQPVQRWEIQKGDIILYPITDTMRRHFTFPKGVDFVVHRVYLAVRINTTECNNSVCWSRHADRYYTKGDNNPDVDPWTVPYYSVHWKVVPL